MSDPPSPAKGVAQPLLPNDWQALAPLVDAVLDAPSDRRAAVLAEVSAGDPARRAELERLVAECERDVPLLNRPAAERFASLLVEEPEVALPEILGGRYRIERELGRGGMARVYLAHDSKHARDVAVKVIRADVAASLGRERFLREIGIAARLRHPNIVPLYDSGDADGVLYFVMPYEAGLSLRARLNRGAVPVAESLSTLRDVARALAYAHEQGVVHRDVKPDNVMLSGGAAVVTDFGIAKAVAVAQTGVQGPTLTQLGAGIGTPAYMAPEQAVGDPATDHRADIYSFGCLAYELFAGKPPFHDLPTHLIIAAHVGTKPTPITEVCATVPASIARLIARCLEKNPAARPHSAQELLSSLEEATTTGSAAASLTAPAWRQSGVVRWAGLTLAAALVGVGAAVFRASRNSGASPPISLAVLPFGNIGADSTMDFVAQGLADEVASALGRVPGIQTKSRSGARAYRGQLTVDVAEVGERLKADYVMQGVVRQQGGRWILSADLERASDATTLWDSVFNVSPDQQAGVAQAIAASLTAALRSRFPKSIGSAPVFAASRRTANPEAYDLYVRGLVLFKRRGPGVRQSVANFQAAIDKEPTFAPAHAMLGAALELLWAFEGTDPALVHDRAMAAASRSLTLDSTLAQGHTALALAFFNSSQWDRADPEFRKAIDLDPSDADTRIHYGRYLTQRHRRAESLAQFQKALELEPVSAVASSWVAYALFLNGRENEGLKEIERAIQLEPALLSTRNHAMLMNLSIGRKDSALRIARQVEGPAMSPVLYVYAATGDSTTALRMLREIEARQPRPWFSRSARFTVMLGLGDTSRALAALEAAASAGDRWFSYLLPRDRAYDPIRRSARFAVLVRRAGLPDSFLTAPRARPTP